ncbi:RDD family protein [Yunchengibacter salinarum]|uniref:RDD family protein n=1 Tax=Yunchengibacter salinarum TaxID=3133399 RepID=UPI0035B6506E
MYAGFWLRAVAYALDLIALTLVSFLIIFVLGVLGGAGLIGVMDPNSPAINLLSALVGWLYFAGFESSEQQATPGKKVLKLIVTDEAGNRLTFLRATGRHLGKILSALILLIGFFMAGWTARKQALHDKLAGTLVWRAPPEDGAAPDMTGSA